MYQPLIATEPVCEANRQMQRVPEPPALDCLAKQFASGWPNILAGVVLAGGAYPGVVASGTFVCMVAKQMLWQPSATLPDHLGEALGFIFVTWTVGAGVGMVWAGGFCIAMVPLVYAVVRSLDARGSLVRLGAFTGGLTGFASVMALLLGELTFGIGDWNEFALAIAVGPGLTTVLGQAGGAWGAWRVSRYERALARALVAERRAANDGTADAENHEAVASQAARLQFGIRHLLWIGIWISLLLTAIRLLGRRFEVVLPLLVGWLFYQAATLWIGERLIRVWGWFRQRRQSCST